MKKKKKKVRLEFRRMETQKNKRETCLTLDKGEKKEKKKSENVEFSGPIL